MAYRLFIERMPWIQDGSQRFYCTDAEWFVRTWEQHCLARTNAFLIKETQLYPAGAIYSRAVGPESAQPLWVVPPFCFTLQEVADRAEMGGAS